MIPHSDNDKDEIIEVRMPRGDYEVLRDIIVREKSLSWLAGWFRTGLLVVVGGSIVVMLSALDKVKAFFS